MIPIERILLKRMSAVIENISFLDCGPNFKIIVFWWRHLPFSMLGNGTELELPSFQIIYTRTPGMLKQKAQYFSFILTFSNRKGQFSISRASGPEN